MKEYYHYTLESKISAIMSSGMYPNHPLYTTTQYYNSEQAGQELGVMAHNIDCALLFTDDGSFQPGMPIIVPSTGRFIGGGIQYQHLQRLKPIAKRRINSRSWTKL
jgi:hypothetical protein